MTYRIYRGSITYSMWALIIANLLLFVAVMAREELLVQLGLWPLDWLQRPWTIVTSIFLHGSIWHIFANMLALYFFGGFLSPLIGEVRFLIVYFLGGIAGSLVYVLLASPFSIVIGASGAIFALGGTLAVMRPRVRVYVFPIPSPVPLWGAVIGGFVVVSLLPIVAWQAHLGGLVFGLIAGYFFRRRGRRVF